jgi:tetratricopeptide (TPR) repeat protein
MAKKGSSKRDCVTRALKNLGIGLVGKIPIAGVVFKALTKAALETAAAQSPNSAELTARFAEMTAERAINDVEGMRQVLLELAGESPDGREEIEKLAEAVVDPEGLQKNERFRAAMERLVEKGGKATDDLEELEKAIGWQVNATGPGAVAAGRDVKQAGTIVEHADTVVIEQSDQSPQAVSPAPFIKDEGPRVAPTRLPKTGEFVLGRNKHFKALDRAWNEDARHIVVFVAEGGVGKTALVKHWRAAMAKQGFRGAACVYDHSFYSQGTSDQTESAEVFIREALEWFGDADPDAGSAWAKGARLAECIARERTLLVLDGVEPLQDPESGHITDPGLRALVLGLADVNAGLCVVTTRKGLADLADYEGGTVKSVDLANLTKATGGALLKKLGVGGTKEEREDASVEFGNHALTITLLGTFLARAHGGDVRKRHEIDLAEADAKAKHKGHAHRVMTSYEKWLGETGHEIEVGILRMMGLFTRPADAGCLRALRREPMIAGLTDGVVGVSDADWNLAVTLLRELRLLAEVNKQHPEGLDAHPLVREHFAERLREKFPEAWRAGHERLYEYLTSEEGCPKEFPDTLEEMQPLFAAVVHGCKGGRHQEAFDQVFGRRMNRGDAGYSWKQLGAFGAVLGAMKGFFKESWTKPAATLRKGGHAFVLSEAAIGLRALGRLAEAVEPMRAGVEMSIASEDWLNAATAVANLSELRLTLGDIESAMGLGEQAVAYAERTGDAFERISTRATWANALHQAGQVVEAKRLFAEAESIQAGRQKPYPRLSSLPGFQYCDLLLAKGEAGETAERAAVTIDFARRSKWLLDIALDDLSLGRALVAQAREESDEASAERIELTSNARRHIEAAVDGLREASQADELPRGLLGRAELCTFTGEYDEARAALGEAMSIATRDPKGPMRLFVTDCHLGYARVALAEGGAGAKGTAATHLAKARSLIEETGYHRRDGELAELEALVG